MDGAGFVQPHVVQLQRVGKVDLHLAVEGMALGDHQHQPVAAVGQGLQVLGAHQAGDDADVGLPLGHGAHDVVRQALAQVDVHVGVAAQEVPQHRRQEFAQRGGVGEHAHMALDAAHVFLHVAAQVFDLPEHHARVGHEGLARRCERHALAGAVQQLGADAFFQVLDARAGRRQGDEGEFRAARHAVGVGDVHHQAQIHKIEMHGHGRHCRKRLIPWRPCVNASFHKCKAAAPGRAVPCAFRSATTACP